MLYQKMLQPPIWLGLSCSLFALPRALGTTLINSTLNSTLNDKLDSPSDIAVCVNNTQHPTWGVELDQFDYSTCKHAVGIIASRLGTNLYSSFDFYSRQVYPSGPGGTGYEAWPLAQGASAGDCALVVRMTRDFARDALPISSSRFAPTSQATSTQINSWLFLLRSIENLLSVCVHDKGLPGWSMDTKNIVIAFWPRLSVMNQDYGIRVISPEPDINTSWLLLDSE